MCLAFPKPQSRLREKARRQRQHAKARKACVDAVWERANSSCESCHRRCVRFNGDNGWSARVGHVDEIKSKAHGGDDTDEANCRLLCQRCHFSGPSGAHRLTPNWRQGS